MVGPRPKGWVGGGEDFEFVRTLDGHIGVSPFDCDNADLASDTDARRNSREPDQALLGGLYDLNPHRESDEGESPLDT